MSLPDLAMPELLPVSRKEQALWLLDRLAPDSAANMLSVCLRVPARLEGRTFARAVEAVVRRHEALRTGYHATGAALFKTRLRPDEVRVELIEQTTADPAEAVRELVRRRLPLDGRLLLRAGLFHGAEADICCLAVHHLVFDTVSGTVVAREVAAEYDRIAAGAPDAGQPVAVLPDPVPTPQSVAYWRQLLAGFDPAGLELDCGRPQRADPTLAGDEVTVRLSPAATAVVRGSQRELRAPEAVILLAGYFLLLAAHGGGPDLTVGSPVNVRPPGAEKAVGYHVNVLPLRVRVDPDAPFRQLVRDTREVFLGALAHKDVPVDELADLLPRAGASWRNMLLRHLFNYVPGIDATGLTIGGTAAEPVVVENGSSKFDLEFFVIPDAEGIRIRAVYGTEVFDRGTVCSLLSRYDALLGTLDAALDTPVGRISVLDATDREVIETANRTARPLAYASVLEAVQRHARTHPERTAVEHGDRRVSYGALWAAAAETGRRLGAAGVTAGDVVALAVGRGPELVAAVLGVWLAGAAYLPVDADHPRLRVQRQLADCDIQVLIGGADGIAADGVRVLPAPTVPPDAAAPTGPLPMPAGSDRAYVIYTSGSTGRAKGVEITHRGLANVAAHFARELDVRPDDGMLWMTTFAFDMAGIELHVPLFSGSRIVIGPDRVRTDGTALAAVLERHRVDLIEATPTTWRLVLDRLAGRLAGKRVIIGGEPVPVAVAQRLVDEGCVVHHAYGPTETTIWSTLAVLDGCLDNRLTVGGPIDNTQVFVAGGPDGRELPVGVRGELCIAGAGVAIGYRNRPELTAERFGEHPRWGRFYRTGDRACWRPDGTIELSGRADRQIKLRGNRVELGEIEAVLRGCAGVKAAAVLLVGDPGSDGVLVAFVEAAESPGLADQLWERAYAELPRSVVPHEFVILDPLPTSANQKVDYAALEALLAERRPAAVPEPEPSAAADGLVARLVELWRDVLGRRDVGPDDNFFARGGHSLLAAQLVQRVEEETGTAVSLNELFAWPTPAGLATALRGKDGQ